MPPIDEASGTPQDYGLLRPIALPINGEIPDAATGRSSRAEYDSYFRIVREQPDLVRWSQSCLDVQRQMLADLAETDLSTEDRTHILAGCLVVLHSTLEKWLAQDAFGDASGEVAA
jgi:hypothetical protein